MNSFHNPARRMQKKTLLLYFLFLALLAVVFVAAAEVVLRHRGIEPWKVEDIAIRVDPGGKFYEADPMLGYSPIPGKFVVTLATGYSFTVTHLPNGHRVTHPLPTYDEPEKKDEIWILGCSMTYGWSLDDDETYSWLLQERLPQYEVVNFAVNGYGTIHSLIQFREALKENTPKVAVVAYSSLHDQRNTFSRIRRKRVAPYNKLGPVVQPYALLENGALRYFFADVEYREFPLMRRLALAHYIEIVYDRWEFKRHQSHAVSEALIAEMADLAKKHGVTFVVANILGGEAMLDWAKNRGIPAIDISVDLNIKENTNLPDDEHPSAIANQKYADTLETFLKASALR